MIKELGNANIHFIGIGGVHMSAMAELLTNEGCRVSGSDANNSALCRRLVSLGIKVFIGHNKDNIGSDVDIVVRNAAVADNNVEYAEAKRRGIKLMERPELLGLLMKNKKYPICISGTHGKTTVTSMIGEIFTHAEKDPTIVNGGIIKSLNSCLRQGHSEYFVAEACEYYDSFLSFFPHTGLILNIEPDHLDYFKTFENILASFKRFASLIPPEGTLVINGSIKELAFITEGLPCRVVTFEQGDFEAKNIRISEEGCPSFDLYVQGNPEGRIQLSVIGSYDISNALAAIAAAYAHGIGFSVVREALKAFTGAKRRFEYKGRFNSLFIYDDYAHHPTAIKVNLKAAKALNKRITVVYQPHTRSRTVSLLHEFSEAFGDADEIILVDIYTPSGREENDIKISSKDIVELLVKKGKNARYIPGFDEAEAYIRKEIHNGMLITMGAGTVFLLGDRLVCEK